MFDLSKGLKITVNLQQTGAGWEGPWRTTSETLRESHLPNSFLRPEEEVLHPPPHTHPTHTPFIIQIRSIIKVPRDIRLAQPEITNCGVILFPFYFFTKHLAGQVQVCTHIKITA